MASPPTQPASQERDPGAPERIPDRVLVVSQPERLKDILSEIGQMTEEARDAAQEDARGSATPLQKRQQHPQTTSTRSLAIANLPSPKRMQRELRVYIEREIRHLRHEARRIVRVSKPGTAYRLNVIYARIRRLNVLLSNILGASVEMLKRFFIRVFIDRQSI